MQIQNNITIFSGADASRIQEEQTGQNLQSGRKQKSFFAGNLNGPDSLQDRIAQRKKEAQEKAMKVVGDVFDADRAIDQDIQSRRDHISEMQQENKERMSQINEINHMQEDLKVTYGGEDSEDYRQQQLGLEELKEIHQKVVDKNTASIMEESSIIKGIKQERLKSSPMVKAQQEAEAIEEAASKEIIGMVVEDSKDHIDEEQEKREEEAEKIEKEKEQKEEFIEAQKEKREEQEEILEDMPVDEMISLEQNKTDIQKEVQDIMDKMKLVVEDIKGAKVDETL